MRLPRSPISCLAPLVWHWRSAQASRRWVDGWMRLEEQGRSARLARMEITVVGAGYVGLVTAVCRAASGDRVSLVERSQERVRSLEAGRIPISEPGLAELLDRHRSAITIHDAL